MADRERFRFAAEEVATWLEEANGSRRARWPHWPDAEALAADLSRLDFDDRFSPHYAAVREVRRVAAKLRKAAAAALENPTIRDALIAAADHAIGGGDLEDLGAQRQRAATVPPSRPIKALDPEALKFTSLLQKVADAAEVVIKNSEGSTRADALRRIYGHVAKTLERHTGKPASVRPTGPDARFVRDVIEHAGLPWRPRIWRRYGEEWAAVRRELELEPAVPAMWVNEDDQGDPIHTLSYCADPLTGIVVSKTESVSNRRQKKT